MALKRINYTGIDFESIVASVVARMRIKYGSQWNDEFADGLATMLIEAFADVCDMNLFYLDQRANECFLATAKERASVIALCKAIGYDVQGAKPAQADLTFALQGESSGSVRVPAGTQIETEGGVMFETTETKYLSSSTSSVTISARQGETLSMTAYSNGEAKQRFALDRNGVISIASVTVNGDAWEVVDGFADAGEGDKVFAAEIDGQGLTWLIFGDGVNGAVPEANAIIVIKYVISIGMSGNVAAGTITKIRDQFTDESGNVVTVTATNAQAASGGADPETIDHAKLWAPRFYMTQDRCVTADDYEIAATAFDEADAGRVAKARAVVTQQTGAANIVSVYVLTYGTEKWQAALPSAALKTALQAYLQEKAMLTAVVEVSDGATQAVNITASVKVQAGFEWPDVKAKMETALQEFFDIEQRDIGQPLRFSDLNALLDGIAGVDWVEFSAPTGTVVATSGTLLVLGTVTLTEASS